MDNSFAFPAQQSTFGRQYAVQTQRTFGALGGFLNDYFDFTLAFEQGVLSLIPALLFLIAGLFRTHALKSRPNVARPGRLLPAKLATCAALVPFQITLIVLWSLADASFFIAIAVSAIGLINSWNYLALSYLEHRRSIKPSIVLGAYLWITIILDVAQARSLFLLREPLFSSKTTAAVLFSAKATQLLLLILEESPKRSLLPDRADGWPTESTGGPLSRCLFWWLRHIFIKGYNGSLRIDNVGNIDDQFSSRRLLDELSTSVNKADASQKHHLLQAIWSAFKRPMLWPIVSRIFITIFSFAQPLLIKRLVSLLSEPTTQFRSHVGWALVAATAFVYLGIAISTTMYAHIMNRFFTILRGSLVAAILNKTLRLNAVKSNDDAAVTLMSADIEGLFPGIRDLYEIWVNVIELVLAIYLLQRETGPACFLVAFPAIVCSFLSTSVSDGIGPARMEWAEATQKRASTTSSILSQIKSLKMMGLTNYASRKLRSLRIEEANKSKKFRAYIVWILGVANMSHHLTPAVVILAAVFWTRSGGDGFTVSQAFTSLSIVALISQPIAELTAAYPTMTASLACLERIEKYILSDEQLDKRVAAKALVTENNGSLDQGELLSSFDEPARPIIIALRQVGLKLPLKTDPTLQEITLDIRKAIITMVVGPVGSGKSLLLRSILGEVPVTKGVVFVNRDRASMAYCDQTPWLRNLSIRNNILAGQEYDSSWYDTVVHACCLKQDIDQFPHRDNTMVGSGGVNLSGGQKQRVALARALYSRKGIVLLDDVFSALDALTSARISSALLGPDGLLRSTETTVIMATHVVHYLPYADQVVVLGKSGEIEQSGSYPELSTQEGYVKTLGLKTSQVLSEEEESSAEAMEQDDNRGPTKEDDKLQPEPTADWALYKFYLSSVEPWYIMVFVLLGIGFIWVGKLPQVWLRIWTERGTIEDTVLYSGVYMVFCVLAIVLSAAVFWWYGLVVIPRSGVCIHQILSDSYLRAPLWFLTEIDTGSVLNRFSQDMSLVDQQIPMAFFETVLNTADTIAAAAIIASGAPYLSIIMVASFIAIYFLQQFYLKTSRTMRHLDLYTKSPLYTFLTEAKAGIITIRAFGWQEEFLAEGLRLLDISQKPYYLMLCIQEWLSLVMGIFVTVISVLLVAFSISYPHISGGGAIRLAMISLMSFNGSLYGVVTAWTKMETSLGAAARVREFARDTPDENLPKESSLPPSGWPHDGFIEVARIHALYRPSTNEILKDVTLSARPGQKIGVCGSSGSGKSSLLLTLLRLLETTSGKLSVDGVDLSTLSRQSIRSHFTVLPQDPIHLPETIRDNLDLLRLIEGDSTEDSHDQIDEYRDQALETALKRVGLWDPIDEAGGLDAEFNSRNLSHGQRQLFALARAFLRKSKVILLDEATSSLDEHTGEKMQQIMVDAFEGSTVLTVVHRLQSIADCDYVIVIENGSVAETGNPKLLMSQDTSLFRKLHDKGAWRV